MKKILISWIGNQDIAASQSPEAEPGPVASTLKSQSFDQVELLFNYPEKSKR